MDGPTLLASAGGGLLRSAMDHRLASPIGFEATMNVAMELENELKTESAQASYPVPLERRSPEARPCLGESGKSEPEDGMAVTEVKAELGCGRSEAGSPTQAMEELLEEEELEEEDADSLCPSTMRSAGSFDGEMSPSVDTSKEGVELLEDDADAFQKLHGALERHGLPVGNGALNGSGRPESSEGDYYDGSEGSPHPAYPRHGLEVGEEQQPAPCHLCPFIAASKFQLNAHLRSHNDHKCTHCEYTSRTEGRLKRHVKDFHAELPSGAFKGGVPGDTNGGSASQSKVKTYRCKQCSYVATVKTDFWDHSKSHIKAEKLLTCPKCPFVTEYKHHLEYHLRNHFGSKPFKCPKCNYSCVNKSMLNSHMKSHSNIYQYRCANCTYATKYCHSLKLHLRKYAHTPSTVLNADGTPNPVPVIDVYGTRRGPRTKKSQEDLYANAGSNGGTGTLSFSPLQLPGNGALSPSAVLPFFYQGASAGLPNGFHPNADGGHLHPRNAAGVLGGNGSVEDDEPADHRRHHSPSDAGQLKCSLCDFSAEHRDIFSKHMLLHAASENQDLCNLYGISSDSLLQDPSQQQHSQIEAAAVVAVATALGLNPSQQAHRADLFRGHPFNLLHLQNSQDHGQNMGGFHKGSNQVPPKPAVEEEPKRSPPNPLEHLRAFSEQVNVKPYMMREFSSNLFSSTAQNSPSGNAASPPSDPPQASPTLNGSCAKAALSRHPSKVSKHGAMRGDRPPHPLADNHPSLGPLDLSSTKGGPRPQGMMNFPYHLQQQQQFSYAQQLQRYPLSSAYLAQQQQQILSQGVLEICTNAPSPAEASTSPNQAKSRRKGKACKLDRICMKLHRERESPVGQLGLTDDSMEDGEVSKNSDAADERSGEPGVNASTPTNGGRFETNGKPNVSPLGERAKPMPKASVLGVKNEDGPGAPEQLLVDSVLAKIDVKEKDPWSAAYQCQYCDMAFKDIVMYTVHMGYHGFKDPFKCNMCGHQTTDKVAFFLHIAHTAHL